jgi:hypothetical protein
LRVPRQRFVSIYDKLLESLMDDKMAGAMRTTSGDEVVSGPVLAKRLGLTATSVSRLAANGVVVRKGRGKYLAWASARAYIGHVSKTTRTSPVQTARERVLRLQGDRLEQQMKVERKELVTFSEGVATAAALSHMFRGSLLAFRTRIGGRLGLSRADSELVYEEACGILTELSRANDYADHLQAVAQAAVEKELAKGDARAA